MRFGISETAADVTRLLKAWSAGDETAMERLAPIVHLELTRIARRKMAGERHGHVLQPSALVNEAFLRLIGDAPIDWVNRQQFYAFSARLMRQILIDFARMQDAGKRGKRSPHVDLAEIRGVGAPTKDIDFLDLDQALTKLAELDARQAQVVELRYFGGLENAEIAAALGISEPTVVRDWRQARAWLYDALQDRKA